MILIFPRQCAAKSFATRLLVRIDHLLDEQRGGGDGCGRRDNEKDVT
jgi:hypothetical protein